MKALEKDPRSYDLEFKKRFPEADFIYDLIKTKIGQQGRVLEIGCGTGQLAIEIAKKGLEIFALDVSEMMLAYAENQASEEDLEIDFIQGNFLSPSIFEHLQESGAFNIIISTFALSEFSPLQQDLFLKQISLLLDDQGVCFIAADTAPTSGLSKYTFSLSSFIRSQVSVFKDFESTSPVKNLEKKLSQYFESKLLYKKKTVKLFEVRKKSKQIPSSTEVIPTEAFLGQYSQLKTGYCIVNGILTRKSIKPGLYRVGSPQKDSPLLVTANYYWTVNTVYKTLHKKKIDCFLLVIDSNGINVWCAAGGGHFTHTQILEAINLFDVKKHVDHTTLILPQLSATGVDRKVLTKAGWTPIFGPVDIKNIDSFLKTYTKTSKMSIIEFNLTFRTFMGIQHAFFISCLLFLPLLVILGFLSLLRIPLTDFWILTVFQLLIFSLVTNMVFIWIYPVFDFTSSFFTKGLIVAIINSLGGFLYLASQGKANSLFTVAFWTALIVVISLFVVLDLAGNTPYTNHLEVESDLTLFMIPAIVLCFIAIIIPLVNSDIKPLLF